MEKTAKSYYCKSCSFYANKMSDWNRHITTRKHNNSIIFNQKTPPIENCNATYNCDVCDKEYKSNNSLWYHKKKCVPKNKENVIEPNQTASLPPLYEMISDLLKQNNELQKQIIELSKEPKVVNNYNTNMNNNNTTNNQFNLNMFLNETCKDALNVQQFLDNMNFTLEDLETVGKSGFVKGISELIVRSLRELEINKRPIHCTDTKRETIYLKEDDVWNKDDDKNSKIKMVIKQVEDKNYRNIREWERIHPEGWKENTPDSVVREQIIKGVCGAAFDEERMRGKVVKEIVKEIQLNKTNLLTSVE
jgi:hypothetical protein